MKKTYMQPEIWVEKMNAEYQVMAGSPRPTDEVTSISTKEDIGITYGGAGNGSARAGESQIWDDEGDDSAWN